MALAILKWDETHNGFHHFQADLGNNKFYAYEIGDGTLKRTNGLKRLQDPSFSSEMIAAPSESQGAIILKVPSDRFSHRNRSIQLLSFRTEMGDGPALSEVIEVIPGPERPAEAFSTEPPEPSRPPIAHPVETVPFSYREVHQPHDQPDELSSAMFLSAIAAAIPAALPIVGQVLGTAAPTAISGVASGFLPLLQQLLGGGTARGFSSGQNGDNREYANREYAQGLFLNPASLAALAGGAGGGGGLAGGGAAGGGLGGLLGGAGGGPGGAAGGGAVGQVAQLVPQLLDKAPELINSLAPVLQQVLSPETLNAIGDNLSGTRLFNAVSDGLLKFGQLGQEAQKLTNAHLENVIQATNNPAFDQLLNLGEGFSLHSKEMTYQRVRAVRLDFAEVSPILFQGRSQLLYHRDRTLEFSLTLQTPRPIRRAKIQLLVKDLDSMEILVERQFRAEHIADGRLPVVPQLTTTDLAPLKTGQEYLVCAQIVWKGRNRRTGLPMSLGTSMSQVIKLVGDYCFDHLGESQETIPLNDVTRFRAYWHQIWQGQFEDRVRRYQLDCKYYYVMERDRTSHARMETLLKLEEVSGSRQSAKLKAGLILSPYRLNELLGQVSDYPILDEAQMDALMTEDFTNQLHSASHYQAEFKGQRNDRAALWIYPELKLQQILLKQVTEVNDRGQVSAFTDHRVYFPLPSLTHFIGGQS